MEKVAGEQGLASSKVWSRDPSCKGSITIHEGLLSKQDHVVIPSSVRSNILHMLHAAHRGSNLPSNTLVTVCSGQGLTAKLRTSAITSLLVHTA